ncbi:hypothetical protein XENORESO_013852 [Xenotaenia resolanae]|uniref:Uncharacterized protein n=1 Tax=Xenotaenia resolanae TaxID=208358 RepID=A0ABV0VQQ3_9TELE
MYFIGIFFIDQHKVVHNWEVEWKRIRMVHLYICIFSDYKIQCNYNHLESNCVYFNVSINLAVPRRSQMFLLEYINEHTAQHHDDQGAQQTGQGENGHCNHVVVWSDEAKIEFLACERKLTLQNTHHSDQW